MKNALLTQPSIFQLISATLVSVFLRSSSENIVFPSKIGKYRLVKKITKELGENNYYVGIYHFNNEKVVIKTWNGSKKDLAFYSLLNEYQTTKIISKKISNQSKFRIPQIFAYHKSKYSFSIVYEYIKGKQLSNLSIDKQIKSINTILSSLEEVSSKLTVVESNSLKQKPLLFYIATLPIFTFLSMAYHMSHFKVIISLSISIFNEVKNNLGTPLTLAHGDLYPENIIIKNNKVYLIDWGLACLTLNNYDYAFLYNQPTLRYIYTKLNNITKRKNNNFLQKYIALVESSGFDNVAENKKMFLRNLENVYAK